MKELCWYYSYHFSYTAHCLVTILLPIVMTVLRKNNF